jgi:hypothetical protein
LSNNNKPAGTFGDIPYIKLAGIGGSQIYVSVYEINTVMNSKERVFYVYPQKEITHTISWNNAHGKQDFISTNHCQNRSNIFVYTLKVCEGDCVISNKFK